ncbi:unnamed protein product, partial [Mesorhabditis belari]|uniref:BHLH domain-containing protein n=1 Tax=Mesorhabditis belari TaxID=2138241 RepID=A0AAF3F0H6_9BILA
MENSLPYPQTMQTQTRQRIRRTNKPMMEKKRRARINRSLAELKQILLDAAHTSPSHGKWEKADILEMTVSYVRSLLTRNETGRPPVVISSRSASDSENGECEQAQNSMSSDGPCSPSTTHSSGTSAPPSPPTTQVLLGSKRRRDAIVSQQPLIEREEKIQKMRPSIINPSFSNHSSVTPSMPSPVPIYANPLINQLAIQQHYEMLLKAAYSFRSTTTLPYSQSSIHQQIPSQVPSSNLFNPINLLPPYSQMPAFLNNLPPRSA